MFSGAVGRLPGVIQAFPISFSRSTLAWTRPSFSNPKRNLTSNGPLPSLDDILKPRVQPKAPDALTETTKPTNTTPTMDRKRSVFVGSLPRWEDHRLEERLGVIFSAFGDIESIRVGTSQDRRKYAHIQYQSIDAAQVALNLANETHISIDKVTGRKLTVRPSTATPQRTIQTPEPVVSLFFTNYDGNRDLLRRVLQAYGFKTFQIHFFLGLQGGGGRIDLPLNTNIREAYGKLNGIDLGEGVILNLKSPIIKPMSVKQDEGTERTLPYKGTPAGPSLTHTTRKKDMKVILMTNLPIQIPEAELKKKVKDFFDQWGGIYSVDFDTQEGGSQQRCYVSFEHGSVAQRAFQSATEAPLLFDERPTTVALVRESAPIMERTLYFGRFKESSARLREAFGEHDCNIRRVKLFYDYQGRPKGSGVVEFMSKESAAQALEAMDGQILNGKKLKLSYFQGAGEASDSNSP